MKKMIQWMIKSSALSALLFPILSIAQESKAEAAIQKIMKENPVMGLSVAVVKNNQFVYRR